MSDVLHQSQLSCTTHRLALRVGFGWHIILAVPDTRTRTRRRTHAADAISRVDTMRSVSDDFDKLEIICVHA